MQKDLISRSALIKALTNVEVSFYLEDGQTKDTYDGTTIMDIIEEQPTAYDVEKIVAELENLPSTENNVYGVPQPYINKHSVLRIVRNGGKE